MERESLLIYRSFFEAIKELEKENQAEIWNAVFELGFYKNEVELHGISKTVFTLIKPQIEANIRKYENGKKGGKPKQDETKTKPKAKQSDNKPKGNVSVNVSVNDNVSDNISDKDNGKKKFSPPTLEEVKNYFKEKGYSVETAERAFNGYDVANWHDTKGNKILNWKQKMINVWFREENKDKNYVPKIDLIKITLEKAMEHSENKDFRLKLKAENPEIYKKLNAERVKASFTL